MTDNRTTELREKLDALGIEHFDYDKGGRTQTMWESPEDMRHFTYETAANPAKTAKLIIEWFPTPEQAIAATLGCEYIDKIFTVLEPLIMRERWSGIVGYEPKGDSIIRALPKICDAALSVDARYDAGFANGVKATLQQLEGIMNDKWSSSLTKVENIEEWIDEQWKEYEL